jgi:GT2 family glycosyltransferase
MMMKKRVYEEVGGFDSKFAVAFNDVDLCLKIRKAGYLIVYDPYAELIHYESKSRGYEDTPEKQLRFKGEIETFQSKWQKELDEGDPYYNRNFPMTTEAYVLASE